MRNFSVLIAIGALTCSLDVHAEARDLALPSEVPLVSNAFRATGSLTEPRAQHAASLLPDGRVLLVGGNAASGDWLQSAEIYDPARETFSATSSTLSRYQAPQLTRLRDGRIMLSGDTPDGIGTILRVEFFDPATERFVAGATGTLRYPNHSATLLDDGRVLIGSTSYFGGSETFDPATSTFAPAGSGTFSLGGGPRPAVRLGDGRVLFAGGPAPSSGGGQHSYAELFVPATNTFVRVGELRESRGAHTLTALPDGRAVAIGGFQSYGGLRIDVRATAELYDPITNAFTPGGAMQTARSSHMATLLSDGRVLVVGAGAEVYDPTTRTFAATASAPLVDRTRGTTTLLRDGRVLVAGGEARNPFRAVASAELYTPPTP
jgi:hypothetical protein